MPDRSFSLTPAPKTIGYSPYLLGTLLFDAIQINYMLVLLALL